MKDKIVVFGAPGGSFLTISVVPYEVRRVKTAGMFNYG
jgi:hypothetical protein